MEMRDRIRASKIVTKILPLVFRRSPQNNMGLKIPAESAVRNDLSVHGSDSALNIMNDKSYMRQSFARFHHLRSVGFHHLRSADFRSLGKSIPSTSKWENPS